MPRSIIPLAVVCAGCGAGEPEGAGPPEVLQVLVKERIAGEEGVELASRLAYGDHDDVGEEDDRAVTEAVAWEGQRIRVVFDELLRGNFLEEIPCADGSWTQVPVGTTFDELGELCPDAGGILDTNGDGGFDDTRLIAGAVVLTCDGEEVPLDVQKSYYQPSGNQVMSSVGVDSLGPAVVIAPGAGMPPGATCGIDFAGSVVDKQDEPVGDTGDIGFTVEPFQVVGSEPADGATDVAVDTAIAIHLNAALVEATVAARLRGGDDDVETTAVVEGGSVVVTVPGGLAAATTYTLTLVAGVEDVHGDALAADTTITWSTR
jgi:hypothetical protein